MIVETDFKSLVNGGHWPAFFQVKYWRHIEKCKWCGHDIYAIRVYKYIDGNSAKPLKDQSSVYCSITCLSLEGVIIV